MKISPTQHQKKIKNKQNILHRQYIAGCKIYIKKEGGGGGGGDRNDGNGGCHVSC